MRGCKYDRKRNGGGHQRCLRLRTANGRHDECAALLAVVNVLAKSGTSAAYLNIVALLVQLVCFQSTSDMKLVCVIYSFVNSTAPSMLESIAFPS